MAVGTPFHPRTFELCRSHDWGQWSGYFSAASYNDFVQPEYAAIRNSAAMIDVSPLYKYVVRGADAEALIDRVITHSAANMAVNQVVYTPWCDSSGMVRQEGTVFRLEEDHFMVCAAEPAQRWLQTNGVGFDVEIDDCSTRLAALSVQGPTSRAVLSEVANGEVENLKFFRSMQTEIAGAPLTISRTGYTGDLGYELWIRSEDAVRVWDALIAGGQPYQISPCGMLAMDVARVEAGLILIDVDYISSEAARVDEEKASPYELGLGWSVKLEKNNFVGRRALMEERQRGSQKQVVGLMVDWEPLEEIYLRAGVMPDLPMTTRRENVPVYSMTDGMQVGRVTSRVWSKLLKKYIALATVQKGYSEPGTALAMEVTVLFERKRVQARVVERPFFRPQRMRA